MSLIPRTKNGILDQIQCYVRQGLFLRTSEPWFEIFDYCLRF